jgi:hypothetical protein
LKYYARQKAQSQPIYAAQNHRFMRKVACSQQKGYTAQLLFAADYDFGEIIA